MSSPIRQGSKSGWYGEYLRDHGTKPDYEPAVMRTDWAAEKRSTERSAKVGALILLALVSSIIWLAWGAF